MLHLFNNLQAIRSALPGGREPRKTKPLSQYPWPPLQACSSYIFWKSLANLLWGGRGRLLGRRIESGFIPLISTLNCECLTHSEGSLHNWFSSSDDMLSSENACSGTLRTNLCDNVPRPSGSASTLYRWLQIRLCALLLWNTCVFSVISWYLWLLQRVGALHLTRMVRASIN